MLEETSLWNTILTKISSIKAFWVRKITTAPMITSNVDLQFSRNNRTIKEQKRGRSEILSKIGNANRRVHFMMLHDGFVVYVIVLLWDIEKNSPYVSRQNRSRFVKKGAHVSWIIRKTSLTSLPYGKIFIQVNLIVEI